MKNYVFLLFGKKINNFNTNEIDCYRNHVQYSTENKMINGFHYIFKALLSITVLRQ